MSQKIKLNFDGDIKTIYHIADIHIRLHSRHSEYRQVFDELYSEISKDTENAIIYVGGDIVHNKLTVSVELIELTLEFFRKLADIAPTIIILGNHDLVMDNKDRGSIISTIVNLMEHPNLYFFNETDVYQVNNVDFGLISVIDEDFEKSNTFEFRPNSTKIGLYHGAVEQAISDTGFKFENYNKLHYFDKFDVTLLGDIHKYQKIQNVYYCGSLIQQDFGEDYGTHGLVKWDIPTLTPTHIPLYNEFGYHTIKVDNNQIVSLPEFSKRPRVRLKVTDSDYSSLKEIENMIYREHNASSVSIDPNSNISNGGELLPIEDYMNAESQSEIIIKYLENRDYTSDEIDEILNINSYINEQIDRDSIQLNSNNIKLIDLEFSNMFRYSEGNYIDFSNMNTIIGLFASNRKGKSSIIEILLFMLFDKTNKATKSIDIINNQSTELYGKLRLSINGIIYVIERHGVLKETKRGTSLPISVEFYIENGKDLKGEKRADTQKIINSYVGDIDNIMLTNIALDSSGGLLKMGQAERKKMLSQFIGMDIFEILYQAAKSQHKYLKQQVKEIASENLSESILDIKKTIDDDTNKSSIVQNDISNVESKLAELRTNRDAIYSKMTPIDSSIPIDKDVIESNISTQTKLYDTTSIKLKSIYDIYEYHDTDGMQGIKNIITPKIQLNLDNITKLRNKVAEHYNNIVSIENNYSGEEIQSQIKTYETVLNQYNNTLKQSQSNIDKLEQDAYKLKDKLSKYNIDDINEHLDTLALKKNKLAELKLTENTLNQHMEHIISSLTKLGDLEYDPNCTYCMNNIFVKDAIDNKTKKFEVNSQLDEIHKTISELEGEIVNLSEFIDKKDNFNKLQLEQSNLKEKYIKTTSELNTINNDIAKTQSNINTWKSKLDELDKNNKIEAENAIIRENISKLNAEISSFESDNNKLTSDLNSIYEITSSLSRISNQLSKYKDQLDKYNINILNKQLNDSLMVDINLIDNSISDISNKLSSYQSSLIELKSNIKYNEGRYELLQSRYSTYLEQEQQFKYYDIYLNMMSKNGIQYDIMTNALTSIEQEANSMLTHITDFELRFEFDNNNIDIYLYEHGTKWNANLASGMEKFISNLVIRIALHKMNVRHKFDFLIVDEGFDALDDTNKSNLDSLFNFIINYYNYIIVVSHLDSIKDTTVTNIPIQAGEITSKIVYGK